MPQLVTSYADRLGITSEDPVRAYAVCGAIYGTYFEEAPLATIVDGSASKPVLDWANLALDRFQMFAAMVLEG